MIHLRKRSVFRPRVIQPPHADDTRGATPERMKHAQGFVERGNPGRGRTGIVTMRDSPIERARARNVISQAQYTAAVKYRHHWYRAGLASPLSSVEIYTSEAHKSGKLSWLDPGDGYGFPVPVGIRDLYQGKDRLFL